VVENLSFDAWGRRRDATDWHSLSQTEIQALTKNLDWRRGFTNHEHLDAVELIHMNGRVYDPLIGRFLTADPFVQEPNNLQSLNRYSYVMNNPLSYTDPSGYFFKKVFKAIGKAVQSVVNFVKDNWKAIASVAIGAVVGLATAGIGTVFGIAAGSFAGAVLSGAGFGFGSAFAGSLLNGRSIGDSLLAGLKGGIIGGAMAGLAYGATNAISGIRQGFYDFKHGGLSGMYNVDPTTGAVTKITSADQVWDRVFLNGMSNDLEGAVLRGTQQNFGQPFTLLHNPTHGFMADLTEAILDKMSRVFGFTPSKTAQQVASLLQTGKVQFITGHSQGGLMLTRAFEILNRQGISLPGLHATFNGAAVNMNTAMRSAYKIGATATWNAHFTDLVPQVIGGSGNPISMALSVVSIPRLWLGDKISPHNVYP
jgi:RHS repeat-associated protein